jgi:glycosyltransferase involved in cell wall biosynthesis
VAELLPALDIFVFPSRSEGMPAAVLEAMSCELPVVAADVGATGEEVVDGVTGLLVPAGDPPALADAIARLGADPAERGRMGLAGRRRVSESFTPDRAVANRLRAWELALARRQTA